MTEPTTSCDLSVKLKEAGAPHAFADFYDGCHVWSEPCDKSSPPVEDILRDAYHAVSYADGDLEQRDPLFCDEEYRIVARAFTAGELLAELENAGLFVRLTHYKAGNDDGYGVEVFRNGDKVFVEDRETFVDVLGLAYLHILNQTKP